MDIYTLDLNFQGIPKTIAAYLIVGSAGPVLVETGPGSTREILREQLQQHGYGVEDIRHVLVTHIHLDHAGAAGWLAQQGAQIYVHHVGAPHLIDPSRLLQSAERIYGEQMGPLWGETLPAPAGKVTPLSDADVVEIVNLKFTALDTPGHAWHHHCFRLGDVGFTGDAAGIRILDHPLVDVPAPPPEFKLEVWHKTVNRLSQEKFQAIYPTHFGLLHDVDHQLSVLHDLLGEAAAFVCRRMEQGEDRDQIVEEYVAWNFERAQAAGLDVADFRYYEVANPHYMSVDGIMRYWERKTAKEASDTG